MTKLPTRQIGPFTVSAIGFGCMNLNHGYGARLPEDDAERLIDQALDLGVSHLDTAALYGGGANERIVARLMRRRAEFTLASKCVLTIVDGKRQLDGRPESITATLEQSLQRLGTDVIDLYYLHRLDPQVPIEESVGALVRAVEAGKIRAIGLSEMSAATLRRAHAVHPVAAMQSEYSAWVRNPEVAVIDACRELGVGFVAFSPLGRGFLAGAVRSAEYAPGDLRAQLPRFQEPQLAHNLGLFERFRTLADDAGCTPAQLALAWTLSRGDHVVPIPGTTDPAHLVENMATLERRGITATALAAVDSLFAPGAVAGRRYSPAMQADNDTELLPEERG